MNVLGRGGDLFKLERPTLLVVACKNIVESNDK